MRVVLYSQLGKFKLPPQPPEGDQIELNLDNPSQTETLPDAEFPSEPVKTETPKERFKRLAKQQGIKLKSDNLQTELLLEKYGKSAIEDLTDEELTEIANNWEKQIADTEKFKRESSFINRLDQ